MSSVPPYDLALTSPRRGFVGVRAAERWEHALLVGNGVMGAMIYGRPLDETIILSRAGLFMPLDAPLPPPDTGARLPEIRRLLSDGRYQDAADFVVKLSHEQGWGEKRWTDPFIPACDLLVRTPERGAVRRYARSVDFATGVASVAWEDDRGPFLRRSFLSRADNVFVLELAGPGGVDYDLSLATRPTVGQGGWRPQWFFDQCIASVETSADDHWLSYRSGFKRARPGSLHGYEVVARLVSRNDGGALILARIDLSRDFTSNRIESIKADLSSIHCGFDDLLARHVELHGKIFDRAGLTLGTNDADRKRPVEELISRSTPGNTSPALVEKQFDAARYVILSSTGELPPALPGIWIGTWGAPWSGDYTQNGNLQTALAGNLPTDMPELMLPYFAYLESQLADYRTNARLLYGARGILVPSRTSTHGLNNHFDGTWPMTFWTAGAAWAAHFFYDYFLYTGDQNFLKERALPFMTEAADFYADFLTEGTDGVYEFSPSYSPENKPANSASQACINATMDVAVARQLLTNLVDACRLLYGDAADVARWRSMLTRLPAYRVNADGALKEWTTSGLEDNYTHRHASHLYALYYGLPAEVGADAGLRDAFGVALEKRLEYRRREPTGEMAFGLVQMGDCALSLGDAPAALEIVEWLSNWYWSPALSTTHDKHSIFNVDICGGFPELLSRMLVDSTTPGRIDLLPALPTTWREGRITGIRCRGRIAVRSLEWSPSQTRTEILSDVDQTVRLTFERNAGSVQDTGRRGQDQEIELLAGVVATITRARKPTSDSDKP